MTPAVTACIPAYRSEAFIDRTLACARAQTCRETRIVVAVDPSGDATAELCRKHAREDPPIEVLAQPERLGAQNANAALAQVDTPFRLLYFHDDVIEPSHVRRPLDALLERPDAASAHCGLREFGLVKARRPAHAYEGPPVGRLIDFMPTRRWRQPAR